MNARRLIAAVLAVLVAGCASAPNTADELAAAKQVKIYRPAELRPSGYERIARLWIDLGREQTRAPEHTSAEEGIVALQVEAARRGANGLINVACYPDEIGQSPKRRGGQPVFICHGNAIRVPAGGG